MQSFSIANGQTKTIKAKPIDTTVTPAQPGAIQVPLPVPSWFGFDPTAISVVPAPDGLTAAITMLKPNVATVVTWGCQNSANFPITGQFEVTSPIGPATTAEFELLP